MPPKSSSLAGSLGLTKTYLLAYNTLNLAAWGTCVIYSATLLLSGTDLPTIFKHTYSPLLLATQSLAILEILHSLAGLVRAPLMTTTMQVASRLLLVWGIMYPFGGDILGSASRKVQLGDYAYLGCVSAWGVTEVIRYGFFAITLSGNTVPEWWTWLRYNTFYVLYPIGISSECTLIVQALAPAANIGPFFPYALTVILFIYIPGSYILYTHMIAQRRKVLRGKSKAK